VQAAARRPARYIGVARYIAVRFPGGFRPRYAYVPRCSWRGREGRPAGRRRSARVSGTIADNVPAPRACVAGLACPWSRRTAMITAFHPLATFSVRFVRVLVSAAGEKVHAAGEKRYLRGIWCPRDRGAAVPQPGQPGRPGPGRPGGLVRAGRAGSRAGQADHLPGHVFPSAPGFGSRTWMICVRAFGLALRRYDELGVTWPVPEETVR
jgi:hypothetical protein